MIFRSPYEIFSLSAALQIVGEDATDALWACSIFLIGNNNEIVATTRPVRLAAMSLLYTQILPAYYNVIIVFPMQSWYILVPMHVHSRLKLVYRFTS